MTRTVLWASAALTLACGSPPQSQVAMQSPPDADKTVDATPAEHDWTPDAAAGVQHEKLAELLREHWQWTMAEYPIWATRLGIDRFDDKIGDHSRKAEEARRQVRRTHRARAAAILAGELSPPERLTASLFAEYVQSELDNEVCELDLWTVSPRNNPVTEWNRLAESHAVRSLKDAENLLSRYRAAPAAVDQDIESLRLGAKQGLLANRESVLRTIQMLQQELEVPDEKWGLLSPSRSAKGLSDQERAAFGANLRSAALAIREATARYMKVLQDEIAPRARGEDKVGVGALPSGAACYRALAREHTTLSLEPKQIHDIGIAEIAKIEGEMRVLGKRALGTDDLGKIRTRLRTDKKLYFSSADEIVQAAERALAAAKAKVPSYLGLRLASDCVVQRIPAYEAPFSTIAYYRQPNPDGSKAGEYFVNVFQPETRPRFEAEVLAFHESIPGHHLQIGVAQGLKQVPAFLKHAGMTAYVEGWALYTERLADEVGLYTGDLDRLGMLSFDAWRASRLVVDTGLHALGWTRKAAEQYMLEHTALTEANIKNEVDRYITWPGQALAYKLGQLEIRALRKMAETELKDSFVLSEFHGEVLRYGAVSLPALRTLISAWVARKKESG
jgi:uncharacterized protein (DUF885 family)